MRLVFVHGIAQQDYTEEQLLSIWTDHLLDHGIDRDKLKAAKPEMAYYGDHLYQWTKGGVASPVPMGPPVADGELAFLSKALDEIARASALDEDAIEERSNDAAVAEGANAIAQSTWLGRRAVAIVSLLEQISPLRGRIAAKVVRQAYVYLANKNARADIDNIVRPRLGDGEVVILSHSLGTIVAFNLLRELSAKGANIKVPLFITVGSPLAIHEVQRLITGDFVIPSAVQTWMNFYDKGDPVTLGRPLASNFAKGIVDTIVDNNTENGHSIAGYLDDKVLIAPLNRALSTD
jgi:pimeloyl-ACP methyl ester carboxylesterase